MRPARVPETRNDHVQIVTGQSQTDGLLGMRAIDQGGSLTLERLRAMQFASLTTPRERGGSGFIPVWPRPVTEAAEDDEGPSFEAASGFPVADIDGDGHDDILVERYQVIDTPHLSLRFELEFRRGEDGAHLWTMEPFEISANGSVAIWFGPVLPGGGRAVVLYQDDYPMFIDCSIRKTTVPLRASVTMFAPEDGSELWTKDFEGSMTYRVLCAPFIGMSSASVVNFTGLVSWMEIAGDGVGNGHGDIYVQTTDYQARDIETPVRSFAKHSVTTTVHVLDDRDGVETKGLLVATDGELPMIAAVSDLSDDGRADLVVAVGGEWSARSLDGSSTYWSAPLPDSSPYFWLETASVTGPDSYEIAMFSIAVEDYDCGEGCGGFIVIFGRALHVIDPASGVVLWGRNAAAASRYGAFDVAGVVDADGGTDFAEIGFDISFDSLSIGDAAGATGDVLWGPQVIEATEGPADTESTAFLIFLGDVDGDGADDYAGGTWTTTGFGDFVQADESAYAGKDGSVVWNMPTFTNGSAFVWAVDGDVNGDVRDDLVRVAAGEDTVDVNIVDGVTLASEFTVEGLSYDSYLPYATDAASQPGNELFLAAFEANENGYSSTITLMSQTTPLWTLHIEPQFS